MHDFVHPPYQLLDPGEVRSDSVNLEGPTTTLNNVKPSPRSTRPLDPTYELNRRLGGPLLQQVFVEENPKTQTWILSESTCEGEPQGLSTMAQRKLPSPVMVGIYRPQKVNAQPLKNPVLSPRLLMSEISHKVSAHLLPAFTVRVRGSVRVAKILGRSGFGVLKVSRGVGCRPFLGPLQVWWLWSLKMFVRVYNNRV